MLTMTIILNTFVYEIYEEARNRKRHLNIPAQIYELCDVLMIWFGIKDAVRMKCHRTANDSTNIEFFANIERGLDTSYSTNKMLNTIIFYSQHKNEGEENENEEQKR